MSESIRFFEVERDLKHKELKSLALFVYPLLKREDFIQSPNQRPLGNRCLGQTLKDHKVELDCGQSFVLMTTRCQNGYSLNVFASNTQCRTGPFHLGRHGSEMSTIAKIFSDQTYTPLRVLKFSLMQKHGSVGFAPPPPQALGSPPNPMPAWLHGGTPEP